jgi:adenosylhomocysteine nucleosidase
VRFLRCCRATIGLREFVAASDTSKPCSVIALVGLAFEARIVAGPGVFVVCRGPEFPDTLQLSLRIGCRSIMSFGVAGGLAPDLKAGDWIVASRVLDSDTFSPTDPLWSRKLLDLIPQVRYGPVMGVAHVVTDPSAKSELHARTGAIAVDMESHIVGRFAAKHGLSFAVVRVVVDPAYRVVPKAALAAMRANGCSNIAAVLREMVQNPAQISALSRIAVDAYAARSAMLRLRRLLGPGFGVAKAGGV